MPEYNRVLIRELQNVPAADPYKVGALYAELGDTADALHFLQIGLQQRASNMIYLRSDPSFAGLRKHPAFIMLIDRVGIPRYAARNGGSR